MSLTPQQYHIIIAILVAIIVIISIASMMYFQYVKQSLSRVSGQLDLVSTNMAVAKQNVSMFVGDGVNGRNKHGQYGEPVDVQSDYIRNILPWLRVNNCTISKLSAKALPHPELEGVNANVFSYRLDDDSTALYVEVILDGSGHPDYDFMWPKEHDLLKLVASAYNVKMIYYVPFDLIGDTSQLNASAKNYVQNAIKLKDGLEIDDGCVWVNS